MESRSKPGIFNMLSTIVSLIEDISSTVSSLVNCEDLSGPARPSSSLEKNDFFRLSKFPSVNRHTPSVYHFEPPMLENLRDAHTTFRMNNKHLPY